MTNLGAHVSIAGGFARACERGGGLGCDVIQIFLKNERRWEARPLRPGEADSFKAALKRFGIRTTLGHDSYLINMASPREELRRRSVEAFADEIGRSRALGLDYLVTHPGSPGKAGEETGIRNMIRGLDEAFRPYRGSAVRVLLETTAGQGTVLGGNFEQLRKILDGVQDPDRLGVCLDTCHVFAAGYDISTRGGYEKTFAGFDRIVGLDRLKAFHLNDSAGGTGSGSDRHAHIGKGGVGLEFFRLLLRDPRFKDIPKVIETPKAGDMDAVNLKLLREFLE